MISNWIKKLLNGAFINRQNLGATGNSWKNSKIPEEQLKIVDKELALFHNGKTPFVYTVAAEALKVIPGDNKLTLLEIGCASGYYSEVIHALTGERFEYTGSDYSDAMINVARNRYPSTKFIKLDIRRIELPDKAYDVVLSGAVLVHVKEWREAAMELARVTKSYLILHRTPVSDAKKSYRTEQKIYSGVPVFYNTFNREEIINLVIACGFRKIFEKNIYANEKKGLGDITYVFERRQAKS